PSDLAIREVIALVEGLDAHVASVVVAVDRRERGTGDLSAIQEVERDHGIAVRSIVSFDDVIEYLEQSGRFAEHLPAVSAYRERYGVTGPSDRGADRGPTTRAWTRSCCVRATRATWPTATATGPSRRSSPTWTPGVTICTSRSRTGSTTSTSGRSCAPRTPSTWPVSTSSASAGGTVAARWSPTATSPPTTTRPPPRSSRGRTASGSPSWASTTCPARCPWRPPGCRGRASWCSGRRARA